MREVFDTWLEAAWCFITHVPSSMNQMADGRWEVYY